MQICTDRCSTAGTQEGRIGKDNEPLTISLSEKRLILIRDVKFIDYATTVPDIFMIVRVTG